MKKSAIILLGVLAFFAAAGAVLYVFPKESHYQKAVRLQKEGRAAEAYREFKSLKGWKDSAGIMKELQKEAPGIPLLAAQKWETVSLGTFEQDGSEENGEEALEWFVISREEENGDAVLLLLSRYCIACLPYHQPVEDITWKDSTLRAYLNGPFFQNAFNAGEKDLIGESVNENPGGGQPDKSPGEKDTTDRVFLLSSEEAAVYFMREEDRWLYARAEATEEALQEGIFLSGRDRSEKGAVSAEEEGFSRWWLRSPGNEAYSAQFVEEDGNIFEGGADVDIDYMYGVRPAVRIRIRSGQHPDGPGIIPR